MRLATEWRDRLARQANSGKNVAAFFRSVRKLASAMACRIVDASTMKTAVRGVSSWRQWSALHKKIRKTLLLARKLTQLDFQINHYAENLICQNALLRAQHFLI